MAEIRRTSPGHAISWESSITPAKANSLGRLSQFWDGLLRRAAAENDYITIREDWIRERKPIEGWLRVFWVSRLRTTLGTSMGD